MLFGDESHTDMITILVIFEGSTIVRGAVQAEDPSQQETIFTQLEGSVGQNSQFMGYSVISASYSKTSRGSSGDQTTITPTETSEGFPVGIVAGAAGGVVGIVIIVLVIWRIRKANRKAVYEERPQPQNRIP